MALLSLKYKPSIEKRKEKERTQERFVTAKELFFDLVMMAKSMPSDQRSVFRGYNKSVPGLWAHRWCGQSFFSCLHFLKENYLQTIKEKKWLMSPKTKRPKLMSHLKERKKSVTASGWRSESLTLFFFQRAHHWFRSLSFSFSINLHIIGPRKQEERAGPMWRLKRKWKRTLC